MILKSLDDTVILNTYLSTSVCVFVCLSIYPLIHTHIYDTYRLLDMHIYAYIHKNVHMYMHIYSYTYIEHIHGNMYARVHTHTMAHT